jgi:S-(hydroxymethyl)glutathione dehydrogenase/alcohol dehydrogenase
MKTTAAILSETSQDLIIDEIKLPESLESGQILVRVITSGICGAQINEIDAVKGPDNFLPHLLGHEGYCEVLEIAGDVTNVKPGDLAIMHWRPGLGLQSKPPKYEWRGKELNAGWVTTFNKHAVVSENRITPIGSSTVPATTLPLLGCALTTAHGVLINEAKVNVGDTVLVFGAGGVGLSMLKILNSLGSIKTIIVDTDDEKLRLAKSFGAFGLVKFDDKATCAKRLVEVCGDELPTVAVDTTGKVPCIELAYEFSHPHARVLLVGVPKKGEQSSFYTLPLHFGKILMGSQGGGSIPQTDIPYLLNSLETGQIDFTDFPTRNFNLEEVNNAISCLRSGSLGRMIIEMNH